MKTINRVAMIVRPKEPFLAWARSLDADAPAAVAAAGDPCSVYLADAAEDETPEVVVARHYRAIFDEELTSWHTRTNDWPSSRTLARFHEWFDVCVVDVVLDLAEGLLVREEW